MYLNEVLFIQGALNIGFSMLQTGYVLYFLPFKEKSILWSNAVGEIVTLEVVAISYLYLFDISQGFSLNAEIIIVVSILGAMAFQMLISIYSVIKAFLYLWKKMIKIRALKFVEAGFVQTDDCCDGK